MSLLVIFAGATSEVVPPGEVPVKTLTLFDWDASLEIQTQSATLHLHNKTATLTVEDDE